MALPSLRSQRFLQAILRGRSTRHVQHPFLGRLSVRGLHTTQQYREQTYSISFGQETDELIESYTSTTKKPTKAARKTRPVKPNTSRLPRNGSNTGSIEITLDDENGAILATKASATDKEFIDEVKLPIQESVVKPDNSTNTPISAKADARDGTRGKSRPKRSQTGDPSKAEKQSDMSQRQPQRYYPKRPEQWQIQKDALERKFGDANWNPRKKLSPDAIQGLRDLHAEDPERYSTPILAEKFKISPEAIRRILKSKWRASPEELEDRRHRWARRHDRIWDHKAALGQRPARTEDRKPEGPEVFEEELRAKQMLGEI